MLSGLYRQVLEMCAINFIYSPFDAKTQLRERVNLMLQITQHRGPDKTSIYSGANFCLGFNRLEITGGPDARQPIVDPDTGLVLICNGEIYNHQELRNRFFAHEEFEGTSDCEIITHLYKKFGIHGIQYLEGQYAFVLVDQGDEKVFFGRDPFGINPLYYCERKGRLVISSEVKGILKSGFIDDPELDSLGIAQSRFFYGPIPPRTVFREVYQLPPGHAATYDGQGNVLAVHQINDALTLLQNLEAKDANLTDDLYKVLAKSVKYRLQGDFVPGLYLSGGIDSAIIAYLVNKLSKDKPIAFSLSFDE